MVDFQRTAWRYIPEDSTLLNKDNDNNNNNNNNNNSRFTRTIKCFLKRI
jgi:hypothetical protein